MNFILRQIEKKIKFLKADSRFSELVVHGQSRIEFLLAYVLGYLWNKNINEIDIDSKEYIAKIILRPTIGDIVQIIRKLDINKKVFCNKRFYRSIDKYPELRNLHFGHGFTYENKVEEVFNKFNAIYNVLVSCEVPLIKSDVDLIWVDKNENGVFKGINYKSNGIDYLPWSCPLRTFEFKLGNFYGYSEELGYFRLSPFIILENEFDFYIYSSVREILTGYAKYNQLVRSGLIYRESDDFLNIDIESDGFKSRSSNGTIANSFNKNYKKYIHVGIKKTIVDFLTNNRSSVSATLWGHGGVGKTAAIQSVCEDLSNQPEKLFDYIVFISAKDRKYDYYQGSIIDIEDNVESYENIIITINRVISGEDRSDDEPIINFEGKLLIVFDDYETFKLNDKKRISEFIDKLNINHHKVIITTRAYTLITGVEIQTNELDIQATKDFLLRVIEIEAIGLNIDHLSEELSDEEVLAKVHEITSGRPLFIYQFAIIIGQKGSITDAIKIDIKAGESAIEFLYGRIFEYLSPVARNIFVVISLFVTPDDLINVINKLKFVLNLESSEEEFNRGLVELSKLKIIEIEEGGFFKVYSKEILQIMIQYFEKKTSNFKGETISRLKKVTREKKLDVDYSLLKNADESRFAKNEEEVISSYRYILNRATASEAIRMQALLHLGKYLFIDRGKKDEAIKVFEEFGHPYFKEGKFNRLYSSYCWAGGSQENKQKAINILLDYCMGPGRSLNIDINLELWGLLLTYRSIWAISNREDLKERLRYGEISHKKFQEISSRQRDVFNQIYKNLGTPLYRYIENSDLQSFSPASRQNVILGIYQFVEICLRLNKYNMANELCMYAIDNFPINFQKQFERKIHKIKKFATIS